MGSTHLAWLLLVLVAAGQYASAQTPVVGVWEGTYRDQPPDGLTEPVKPFRLEVSISEGDLTAVFYPLGTGTPKSRKVSKIQRVGSEDWTYCLSIEENDRDVYAWNVTVDEDELQGVRNSGPCSEIGVGSGARFFRVDAKRIPASSNKASGKSEKR